MTTIQLKRILLVGGDRRQRAIAESVDGIEVARHWENNNSSPVAPTKEIDAVVVWAKHCSHGLNDIARKLAGQRKVSFKIASARPDLVGFLEKLAHRDVMLRRLEPKELRRLVRQEWDHNSKYVKHEAIRIATLLQQQGIKAGPSNIEKIISKNRRGWLHELIKEPAVEVVLEPEAPGEREEPTAEDREPFGGAVKQVAWQQIDEATRAVEQMVSKTMRAVRDVAKKEMAVVRNDMAWEKKYNELKTRWDALQEQFDQVKKL